MFCVSYVNNSWYAFQIIPSTVFSHRQLRRFVPTHVWENDRFVPYRANANREWRVQVDPKRIILVVMDGNDAGLSYTLCFDEGTLSVTGREFSAVILQEEMNAISPGRAISWNPVEFPTDPHVVDRIAEFIAFHMPHIPLRDCEIHSLFHRESVSFVISLENRV